MYQVLFEVRVRPLASLQQLPVTDALTLESTDEGEFVFFATVRIPDFCTCNARRHLEPAVLEEFPESEYPTRTCRVVNAEYVDEEWTDEQVRTVIFSPHSHTPQEALQRAFADIKQKRNQSRLFNDGIMTLWSDEIPQQTGNIDPKGQAVLLHYSRKWYIGKGLLVSLVGTFLWFLYSLSVAHLPTAIGGIGFLAAAGCFVLGFNALCQWEDCTAHTAPQKATRPLILVGLIATAYLQGACCLHAHLSWWGSALSWLLLDALWLLIAAARFRVKHEEHPEPVKADDHGPASGTLLAMRVAFFVTIGVIAILFIGSTISHSLALLGDAFHNLVDLIAYGLGWYAARRVQRSNSNVAGSERFNVLAGHWNSLLLLGASLYILWEAFERFQHPQAVTSWIAIICALIGIGANAVILRFMKESDYETNASAKAALADAIGDMAASAAVVVANILIAIGWSTADTWCSSVVALIMVTMAWRIIRRTASTLLGQ